MYPLPPCPTPPLSTTPWGGGPHMAVPLFFTLSCVFMEYAFVTKGASDFRPPPFVHTRERTARGCHFRGLWTRVTLV